MSSALVVGLFVGGASPLGAQSAAGVDFTKIGPQVGAVAPAFSGLDQNGVPRRLASAAGPKGTMLVFFRSADW